MLTPANTLPKSMLSGLVTQLPAPSEMERTAEGPADAVPVKSTFADPLSLQKVSCEPHVPAVLSENDRLIVMD